MYMDILKVLSGLCRKDGLMSFCRQSAALFPGVFGKRYDEEDWPKESRQLLFPMGLR